ncbi:lysylphosphatidylglycerol synthase domain-containing protein [Caballeronia sp. Lep1P3]|uniref:lysylphosphatidylglycerol synthase domain-containing protein n=1 Tax=Caballeronia sp. Lep1P3 TaxID=2878150 RepID=UPI001FCFA344|nr:lysylphosphatidylglycerol synthase domain-containing protein [Caballeronia sp. Lep1P3]
MTALLTLFKWLRWPAVLALLAALASRASVSGSLSLIREAGPMLLLLVPLHALPLLLDARAWQLLLDGRIGLSVLWRIAVVREAVGRLLPVAGVAGEVVGIRLAMRHLPDASKASASVVVEVLVTIAVQFALTMLGLTLLLAHAGKVSSLTSVIGWALVISLPIGIAAFALAHKGAPFRRLESIARSWLGPAAKRGFRIDGARVDCEVRALLRRPRLCLGAFAWQFAGYVLGALEIELAMQLLGHPISINGAVAVEALVQAVRNAAFVAPAGLGVQEVAIVTLSAAFGIDGESALSLALIKRMREVIWAGIGMAVLRIEERITMATRATNCEFVERE